jgi:hypothetical protein
MSVIFSVSTVVIVNDVMATILAIAVQQATIGF